MRTHNIAIGSVLAALLAAAVIAGCGGSSGSALPGPGGGGGHPSPTPTSSPTGNPSPSPSPSSTPGPSPSPGTEAITGMLQYATGGTYPNQTETIAKASDVDVTCGCAVEAGTGRTDSTGTFTIMDQSPPIPSPPPSPGPYILVAGRNYMVIGTQTQAGNKSQEWTMVYVGSIPSHNLFLNTGNDLGDTVTAAVALWVYGNSSVGGPVAFDDWNFFTLQAFYQHLLLSPTSQETTLLNDIVTEQEAHLSMYPAKPPWRPNRIKNTLIAADVAAINASTDPSVPTPCPGSPPACTGTPTP